MRQLVNQEATIERLGIVEFLDVGFIGEANEDLRKIWLPGNRTRVWFYQELGKTMLLGCRPVG